MARPKHPEKLLSVSELRAFTGESKGTILARFKSGGDWHAEGLLIGVEYRLPVSAYNRWLEKHRLSMEGASA